MELVVALLAIVVVGLLAVLVLVARQRPDFPPSTGTADALPRTPCRATVAHAARDAGQRTPARHRGAAGHAERDRPAGAGDARRTGATEPTRGGHRTRPARARRRADQSAAGRRSPDPGADRDHAVVARGAVEHDRALASGASAWPRTCCGSPVSSTGSTTGATSRCPARAASPTTRSCSRRGSPCTWTSSSPSTTTCAVLDATSDVEREHARKEFLKDVRLRLREVTRREYVDPAGGTVDCVPCSSPTSRCTGSSKNRTARSSTTPCEPRSCSVRRSRCSRCWR